MANTTRNKGQARPRKGSASSARGLGLPAVESAAVGDIAVFLVKVAVFCGLGYLVYYKITNRFQKKAEDRSKPTANVTEAQAQSRAAAIAGSMGVFTTDFDTVARNISGLNYNGYIRVYNAFGKQKGHLLAGELNLDEWIRDQFSDYEVAQLSGLLNGAFLA